MKNNTEQPVSTTSHTFRRIPVIVALVLFALATSAFLSRVVLEYSTPRVVAFDMERRSTALWTVRSEAADRGAVENALLIGLTTLEKSLAGISNIMYWSFWFHLPWFRARLM